MKHFIVIITLENPKSDDIQMVKNDMTSNGFTNIVSDSLTSKFYFLPTGHFIISADSIKRPIKEIAIRAINLTNCKSSIIVCSFTELDWEGLVQLKS